MMPMPPTRRLDGGHGGQECGEDGRGGFHGSRQFLQIIDGKIVCNPGHEMPALAEQLLDFAFHVTDGGRARDGHQNDVDVRVSGQPALHGLKRHQRKVVLILSPGRLSLWTRAVRSHRR